MNDNRLVVRDMFNALDERALGGFWRRMGARIDFTVERTTDERGQEKLGAVGYRADQNRFFVQVNKPLLLSQQRWTPEELVLVVERMCWMLLDGYALQNPTVNLPWRALQTGVPSD